jgi:hypothetical protein
VVAVSSRVVHVKPGERVDSVADEIVVHADILLTLCNARLGVRLSAH